MKTPVCSHCRSDSVLADAYAQWDNEAQQWEITDAFAKGAFCHDCDGETSIDWIGDEDE